jgi:hypothetical protein
MAWYLFLAGLLTAVCAGLAVKRLRNWFLLSGSAGLLLAFILSATSVRYRIQPVVILVLWPASVAGLANPSGLLDNTLVALVEFGGNFILYGGVGAIIGLTWQLTGGWRRRTTAAAE